MDNRRYDVHVKAQLPVKTQSRFFVGQLFSGLNRAAAWALYDEIVGAGYRPRLALSQ